LLGRLADFERVDVDRLGDVLQLIGDLEVEPPLHLPIGLLREADRAGTRNAFVRRSVSPLSARRAMLRGLPTNAA
jgi:hypothetical protein